MATKKALLPRTFGAYRNGLFCWLITASVWLLGMAFIEYMAPAGDWIMPSTSMVAEKGCAYVAELPRLQHKRLYVRKSDMDGSFSSQTRLTEDGKRVGSHASHHDDIRKVGEGAYSHWGNTLYFSASDCSDPRKNGRTYSVSYKSEAASWFRGVMYASVAAWFFLFWAAIEPMREKTANSLTNQVRVYQQYQRKHANTRDALKVQFPLFVTAGIVCYVWGVMALNGVLDLRGDPWFENGVALKLAIALIGAAWLATKLRPGGGTFGLVTSLMFCAMSLPLFWLWGKNGATSMMLAGALPYSDAGGYFQSATDFLFGRPFAIPAANRPLPVLFLVLPIAAAPKGLEMAFMQIATIATVSVSAAYLLQTTTKLGHPIAGITISIGSYLFYSRSAGAPATEYFGIAWGLLSVAAFLWLFQAKNVSERNWLAALAMFSIMFGLIARAGMMFCAPCLLAMLAWEWHKRRMSATTLFFGTGGVVFAVVAGLLASALFVEKGTVPFGNFAYTFHGLISGADWSVSYVQFGADRVAVLRDAIRLLLDDPFALLRGVVRAWRAYFISGVDFSYMKAPSFEKLFRGGFWIGLVVTVFACRRDITSRALLSWFVGTLLSVPFAAPWDSDAARVYATTTPFQLLLVGKGFAAVTDAFRYCMRATRASAKSAVGRPLGVNKFSGGMGGAVLATAIFSMTFAPAVFLGNPLFGNGGNADRTPYAALHIVAPSSPRTYNTITQSEFRANISTTWGLWRISKYLGLTEAGYSISSMGNNFLIIAPTSHGQFNKGYCVQADVQHEANICFIASTSTMLEGLSALCGEKRDVCRPRDLGERR
jgi:hypothetical protein